MVETMVAAVGFALALLGEERQRRRTARLKHLAFGPKGVPRTWARFAPLLVPPSVTGCLWASVTLLEPATSSLRTDEFGQAPAAAGGSAMEDVAPHRIIFLLDVSRSMREAKDAAGVTDGLLDEREYVSRSDRAAEHVANILKQARPLEPMVTVIAFFDDARPFVIDTRDVAVAESIARTAPWAHFLFEGKRTDLFAGLQTAFNIAAKWPRGTARLVLLSDGDAIPPGQTPQRPASIASVDIIGLGSIQGVILADGQRSRQRVDVLEQLALRLDGNSSDGNFTRVRLVEQPPTQEQPEREFANDWIGRLVLFVGALVLSFQPIFLIRYGSSWRAL